MQKKVLRHYMEAIYSRCFRMLRDPDQAWDALQDVFASFYSASQKKEIQEPLFYLYRSSTNHCINLLRRQKRMLRLSEWEEPGALDGVQAVEGRLMVDSLLQMVGEDSASLLVYRHVDQMTYAEIGALVGMTDRGVKKKLDRTEAQIRQLLKGQR